MKTILLLFGFLLFTTISFAADTTWYDAKWKKTDRISATYFRPAPQKTGKLYHIVDYYKDGIMQGDGWSYSDTAEIWEGRLNYYHRNGNIQSFLTYKNNIKTDTCKQFFPNGDLSGITFYKNDQVNGPYIEYFKNGKIKRQATYQDGKVDGTYKEYFESGILKNKTIYKADLISDTSFTYYENGKLSELMPFDNGLKTGTHLKYYETGELNEKFDYKFGQMDGQALSYYKNGKVKQSAAMKNNEYNGTYKEYYPDGSLSGELNYVLGKAEGKVTNYFRNGKVERTAFYEHDQKNGPYNEFDEDGRVLIDCYYKDGKMTGHCFELSYDDEGKLSNKTPLDYHLYIEDFIEQRIPNHRMTVSGSPDRTLELKNKNGVVTTTGTLKNGEQQGEWKYYNDKGDLLMKEHFENGKLNGDRILYNSKGAEIKKIPYKNGLLHGVVVEWDEQGEASLNMFYKNGERIKDRQTFYKEFYSKGVITKGNMQLINLDELEEKETDDDAVVVKEEYVPREGYADVQVETVREKTYKSMDEMNKQDAERASRLVPMDTSYAKTDINAKIMILTALLDKQTLETATKNFNQLLFKVEITNDGYFVMERPKSYKPKSNEIAVFYEDNEGDFSEQQISVSIGTDIKKAILNHSFKPYKIISILDGGIFDMGAFPGMYVYDLIETAAKN